MRILLALLLVTSCSGSETEPRDRIFSFGPYDVAPSEENMDLCVQISLRNTDYIYVNAVELTTGPGFHHSNWFFVPDGTFSGDDGTFVCDDRGWSEAIAALFGGVLFAQSTQAPHEVQQFPEGVVVRIPPQSKIMSQIHLLNSGDTPIHIAPKIQINTIPAPEVATILAGISFENQALALPTNRASRFTTECDIGARYRELYNHDPDFKIYYALAHYHELGTGLTLEAIRPDGTASTIYSTKQAIGDTLGGMLTPAFDMTGYTKIRLSCDYFNPRSQVVKWGIGDQEMCAFLAFSDSPRNWGGGITMLEDPQNEMQVGNEMHYSNVCTLFSNPLNN